VPVLGGLQLARHRVQDLLFPDVVIDPLPAEVFRSGHIHANYKAPGGSADERVKKDPIRNGSRRC
jgi:hypothetical protein